MGGLFFGQSSYINDYELRLFILCFEFPEGFQGSGV